jgi:hypothetical protein
MRLMVVEMLSILRNWKKGCDYEVVVVVVAGIGMRYDYGC